jgi:hypothetical protein
LPTLVLDEPHGCICRGFREVRRERLCRERRNETRRSQDRVRVNRGA